MAIKYYDLVTEDWEDWYGELRRGTRGEVNINGAFKKAWDSNPCPHIHDLYGRHPGEPGFDRSHVITFQPWTSTNSLPSTAGNYYLTDNVTISTTWGVPTGTTNFCLNGFEVRLKDDVNGSVMKVDSGRTLNIYDCYAKGNSIIHDETKYKHEDIRDYYADSEGSTLTVDPIMGGVITGGKGNTNGGGLEINSGKVNMYGGTIAGNIASGSDPNGSGGGVYVNSHGEFSLKSGTLCYNAGACGGGIGLCDGSKLIMTNGLITKNATISGGSGGGGVVLRENGATNPCEARISGGFITHNYASGNGGGVLVVDGTLYISDGEISDNIASMSGGAVCLWFNKPSGFELSGGKLINNHCGDTTQNVAHKHGGVYVGYSNATNKGTFNISGNPVITRNTSGTSNVIENVYLPENSFINIKDTFDAGALIGITTQKVPTASVPVIFTIDYKTNNGGDESPSPGRYFSSDNPNYELLYSNTGEAQLSVIAHFGEYDNTSGIRENKWVAIRGNVDASVYGTVVNENDGIYIDSNRDNYISFDISEMSGKGVTLYTIVKAKTIGHMQRILEIPKIDNPPNGKVPMAYFRTDINPAKISCGTFGRNIISDNDNIYEYNLIVLRLDDNPTGTAGVLTMYINDTKITGESANVIYDARGDIIYLGKTIDNTTVCSSDNFYKYFAVFEGAQSDDEIRTRSDEIMSHYDISKST